MDALLSEETHVISSEAELLGLMSAQASLLYEMDLNEFRLFDRGPESDWVTVLPGAVYALEDKGLVRRIPGFTKHCRWYRVAYVRP